MNQRFVLKAFIFTSMTLVFGVDVISAKPAKPVAQAVSPPKKNSDPGFLFLDEVTKEIVVDVHRDHLGESNPFDDLAGKFKPDSKEYRALLAALGVSSDKAFETDENVKVKSLKALRLKFDQEFGKIIAEESVAVAPEAAPELSAQPAETPALAAPLMSQAVSSSFSEISESGFSDPRLGDYRLIPLERGLMMAGKSGEKRVFSNREVLKDDVFKVAIGENGSGEKVLAILHQAQKQEADMNGKFTVWVLALTGSRIGWTKTLEFANGESVSGTTAGLSSGRSTASEQPPTKPALTSQITLSGETVSIAIGGSTEILALKTGEPAIEIKGTSPLTPASEN